MILLLNGSGNGSGNNSKGNNQKSDKKGKNSKGSMGGSGKSSGQNSGLSNNEVLEKLKSDDMVNQGEYIKKKIQSKKFRGDIRW